LQPLFIETDKLSDERVIISIYWFHNKKKLSAHAYNLKPNKVAAKTLDCPTL